MSASRPSKKSTNKFWIWLGRFLYVLAWPALYIYLRRGGVRTRLIVTSGDSILLVKDWLGDNSWKLPGGGLHKGEMAEAGAMRELQEETGLIASIHQLKSLGRSVTNGHGFRITIDSFWLELPKTTAPTAQRGEILDAQWLPLDEALDKQPLSDNTRQLIERWRSQLWAWVLNLLHYDHYSLGIVICTSTKLFWVSYNLCVDTRSQFIDVIAYSVVGAGHRWLFGPYNALNNSGDTQSAGLWCCFLYY